MAQNTKYSVLLWSLFNWHNNSVVKFNSLHAIKHTSIVITCSAVRIIVSLALLLYGKGVLGLSVIRIIVHAYMGIHLGPNKAARSIEVSAIGSVR